MVKKVWLHVYSVLFQYTGMMDSYHKMAYTTPCRSIAGQSPQTNIINCQNHFKCWIWSIPSTRSTREQKWKQDTQLSQRGCAMLRVVGNFANSCDMFYNIRHNHSDYLNINNHIQLKTQLLPCGLWVVGWRTRPTVAPCTSVSAFRNQRRILRLQLQQHNSTINTSSPVSSANISSPLSALHKYLLQKVCYIFCQI